MALPVAQMLIVQAAHVNVIMVTAEILIPGVPYRVRVLSAAAVEHLVQDVTHIAVQNLMPHNFVLKRNMNVSGMMDIMSLLVILLVYLRVILLRWKNARQKHPVFLELIIHPVFLPLGGVIPKGLTIQSHAAADNIV